MDKSTRLRNAVEGKDIDKIPFSFWTHLPEYDRDPKAIAEETYKLYRDYDLDFIKLMNNGMYTAEAFGATIDNSDVPNGGTTKLSDSPINEAEDLEKLTLETFEESIYDRELEHLKNVLDLVDGEAPVLITVFSPFTTIDKLALGKSNEFIEAGKGDLLIPALELITDLTIKFSKAAIALGASGIYFASQMSSYDRTSKESYETYGVPYDLQILESVKEGGWLNTIHVHGENTMFDVMKDYPVPVFNWHNWDTEPSVEVGQEKTNKAIMGGIAPAQITLGNIEELTKQVSEDIKRLNGKSLILSSNCSVMLPFEDQTIQTIQKVAYDTFEEIK